MEVTKAGREEKTKSLKSLEKDNEIKILIEYLEERYSCELEFELVRMSYSTMSKDDYSASLTFNNDMGRGKLEASLDENYSINDWDISVEIYDDDGEVDEIRELDVDNGEVKIEETIKL